MKIVIDMMGGDNGLKATIPSTMMFIENHKDIELFLVGDISQLTEFNKYSNVHLVNSETIIKMDADPLSALRDLKSSLMVGVKTFLDNKCDALISAGSTGALLTAATFKIKRIEGVTRPGLITPFPTYKKNKKFVCCDLGANTLCTKEELNQFATMGSIYYKTLFHDQEFPRVYQLNIGTESEKGTTLNNGEVDVLITDGYSGNIFLKTMEGTAKAMSKMLKDAFKRNIFSKIGYLFVRKGVNEMKEKMDYKNVGGAMLMGVNGVVIKAHGSSDPKGFLSALENSYVLCKVDIVNKFKENINK